MPNEPAPEHRGTEAPAWPDEDDRHREEADPVGPDEPHVRRIPIVDLELPPWPE